MKRMENQEQSVKSLNIEVAEDNGITIEPMAQPFKAIIKFSYDELREEFDNYWKAHGDILIKQANYVGAATVEFLLDKNKKFYFIEVNTRIQVEHPVSEMVTGKDLIKLQLKAAAGQIFKIRQKDIKHKEVLR